MLHYLLEIDGQPVASFGAEDDLDAMLTVESPWFRGDLMDLSHNGDGQAPLSWYETRSEEFDRLDSHSKAPVSLYGSICLISATSAPE